MPSSLGSIRFFNTIPSPFLVRQIFMLPLSHVLCAHLHFVNTAFEQCIMGAPTIGLAALGESSQSIQSQ